MQIDPNHLAALCAILRSGSFDQAAADLRVLQKQLKPLETRLKKLRMAADDAATQRAALEEMAARTKGASALSAEEQKRHAELTATLGKLEKKSAAQPAKVAAVEKELEELPEHVLQAGGIRLRAAKAKGETLRMKLDSIQQQPIKAHAEAESLDTACNKLRAAVAKSEAVVKEAEEKTEQINARIKEIEASASEVMARYEQCERERDEREQALEEMAKEHAAFKDIVGKVRTVEIELAAQLEDFKKVVRDHDHKGKHWTEKLASLTTLAAEPCTA